MSTSLLIAIALNPLILSLFQSLNILSLQVSSYDIKANPRIFRKTYFVYPTQYHLLYFIKRLIFIMTHICLNSYLFILRGLNICFLLLSLIFLIIFKPYKEKTFLISSLSAEGCILIINILVYPILFDIQESKQSLKIIETMIIMIIYIEIGIQTGISAYEAVIKAKELVIKDKKHIKGKSMRQLNILNLMIKLY